MNSLQPSIGILGAGITGLSAAWQLKQNGLEVRVYEKSGRPGGAIQTEKKGEWLWEKGPNSLLVRSDRVWKLLEELGLNEEIAEAGRESKKRYILRDGSLHPLPTSPGQFIGTGLLSAAAKWRICKEPFIDPSSKADESIAGFISRRLGREVLDYAVNPFVAGIYAGDPEQLSVRQTFSMLHEAEQKHGSIAGGFIKKKKKTTKKALISFRNGLQTLPEKLGGALGNAVRYQKEITAITPGNGSWEIRFRGEEAADRHDIIISTLPAYLFSDLMTEGSKALDKIGEITYSPLSVISLGYRSENIHHPLDGFGMLIPGKEPCSHLGTLFSSSLFEGRAPKGHALLTSFIGGARDPELAGRPKEELVQLLQLELDRLLGVAGTPEMVRHTYWEKAIPQYELGYEQYLEAMDEMETTHPGLYLAGNFRGGVSVPDCITTGFETAEKVTLFIRSKTG